jgi:hypothetical protein
MRLLLPLVLAFVCNTASLADATLFVQEPYGLFGAINPTGHASIYLSRVCAETPLVLRRCGPGELGIVISRYRKISGFDWIAIPLVPYLYAVEEFANVPQEVNSETVASLLDDYRRKHLQAIIPDGPGGQTPKGSWVELLGAAYNRKIYGFQIETTEAQDDRLIAAFNYRKNKSHFNLFFNNCADFSRNILNFYYPGAIRRDYITDAGITTPQQIARCMISYARHHRDLPISVFYLQQIPGSRRPSYSISGVSGGFVKKYILPLAAFHPWVASGVFAVYFVHGRFNLAKYAENEYGALELSSSQR